MADKPDPSKLSSRFADVQASYQLVDALIGGTTSMRQAGTRLLPRNSREEEPDWRDRLNRSVLYNVYKRSIQQAAARLFSADVLLTSYPAEVVVWGQDADAQGRDVTQFTKAIFIDALNRGVAFILVEFPERATQPATLADSLATGDRPYWVPIGATQVLAAHSKLINGAERLTHFRFKETVLEVADDGLEETLIEQVKAFYQPDVGKDVTWQTWRYDDIKGWTPYREGVLLGQPAIPIAPIYTNRTGFMIGSPPLMDLAEVNVTHWQSMSEQRNILHVARVPFLHINGWEDTLIEDPITKSMVPEVAEVNIYRALLTNSPNASAEWVETNGQGLAAGATDLKDLEEKMDALGLSLTTPQQPGGTTATETAVTAAEAHSCLKDMARALSDSLELALFYTGFYLDVPIPDSARVVVDTTFASGLTKPQENPNSPPVIPQKTAQET